MNPEIQTYGAGRTIGGIALAILLGIVSPLLVLTEMLSLMMVVLLPGIGIVLLNRWAGKIPAFVAGAVTLIYSGLFFGGNFLWVFFMSAVMPAAILLKNEKKPFFVQMKSAIIAFCCGLVASVLLLYFSMGANMIERTMQMLPEAMRALPAEMLNVAMENFSSMFGSEMTAEAFYLAFEDMIKKLIPLFQLYMPGLLFSGSILTAVLCVGINGALLNRKNLAAEGAWIPVRDWALPSSTTWGLLLILAVSYGMAAGKMQHGETVFITVQSIASCAFCVQAAASVLRRVHARGMKASGRAFVLAAMCGLCLSGGMNLVAIYGGASAVFGVKGAMRQNAENMKDKQSDEDNRGGK